MIRVVVDDLAFVNADAVVRPSTAALEPTVRSLRRLEQVGGPAFWKQLRLKKELAVGAAVVTSSGDLPCEFVIHAVVQSSTVPVSPSGVRLALKSTRQRAADWQLARIAIPPLGTGAGNLSMEDAARLMIEVLLSELPGATYPEDVCIVVESEDDRSIFEAYLERKLP
ncbi:MAG: macro domain-containing protein [Gemmatimonadales bacterium]